jgi:hypothetical protein
MELNWDFALTAGIFTISAYLVYIYSILFGEARPSRSAWWILFVVWAVLFGSSFHLSPGETYQEKWNALGGNWISVAYIAGSLILALLSLWKHQKDSWSVLDWLCVSSAGIAVICYFLLHGNLLWSLFFSILADFFGMLPIMKNAWRNPRNEPWFSWLLEATGSIIAVVAVTNWVLSLEYITYWVIPVYATLVNGITFVFCMKRFLRRTNPALW